LLSVYELWILAEKLLEFNAVNSHTAAPLIYSDLLRPWIALWQVHW